MRINRTKRFDRLYRRLPRRIQNQVDKQLLLLLQNPHHPSLRLHKMEGYTNLWEVRIGQQYRLTLSISGEEYILQKVGSHDILRKP